MNDQQRITGLLEQAQTEAAALLSALSSQRDTLAEIDKKFGTLGRALGMLGSDPQRNIDVIVESVAAILGAPVSLYNRLDRQRNVLATWSIFNPPPDYVREDPATGHICFEATMKTESEPVVLEELAGTIWQECDSVVKKYGLRAYLGFPVKHRGDVVGSLCMVDLKARRFSAVDVLIVNVLAKAMSIEEERKAIERELEERLATIEHQERELRAFARLPA